MARKSLEELQAAKTGSREDSQQYNPGGMYVLDRGPEYPENPAEGEVGRYDRIPAMDHPKYGTVQADAYMRLGYEWERPLTEEEMRPARLANEAAGGLVHHTTQPEVPVDTVPRAQFDALEARIAELEGAKKPSKVKEDASAHAQE